MSGETPSSPDTPHGEFKDGFIGFTPDMLCGLADMAVASNKSDARDLLLLRLESTLADRLDHLDEDHPEYTSYERAREYVRELSDRMLNKEFFDRSKLEN